jgi:RNA polymerase sigma factor (sigma-70 family)
MVDEAAVSMTSDDAVRRMLAVRIDDAYRLATFILHDRVAAEDAVQEASLLAWNRRRSLRDGGAADGWFTRIVINVCRDELRRRARRPRLVLLDPETGMAPAASAEGPDLTAALSRLSPEEQGLLALRFGRELTVPEIAAQLDIPDGTVKSRLHAALQHLRAALEAERRIDEATR